MATTPLSLADHVCLAIVHEGRTHGWAIVKLLAPTGELGRIWSLSRPLTYRSIDRLADAGLVARADAGRRTDLRATAAGRREAMRWLDLPVDHLRDLRTEFVMKVTLRQRAGLGVDMLVERQRDHLAPAIRALREAHVIEPVDLWRRESAVGAERFLELLADDVLSAP